MKLDDFLTGFLEDHAPAYVDMIRDGESNRGKYGMGDYRYCIVGTCHGHTDGYTHIRNPETYCRTCNQLGFSLTIWFPRNDGQTTETSKKTFQDKLTYFAKHFLECHSKVKQPIPPEKKAILMTNASS